MKIRSQLILGIITIIIVSVLTTTYVLVKDAESLIYKELKEKGVLLTSYLKGAAVDPIINRDEVALMSYIKKTSETDGIVYIIITDRRNQILASNEITLIGNNLYKTLPILKNPPMETEIRYSGNLYRTLNFNQGIYVSSEMKNYIGRIYVGFDKAYVQSKMMKIYLKSGIIGSAIIALSFIFILFFTGRIIGPLNVLIKGTEIIAEGDMNHKIRIKVKNEFRSLANSFNGMTEKLKDYYDGILNAFTMAIDTKDKYTPGHSKRAAEMAVRLGKYMGLKPRQLENIRIAGILKDIGNIGIQSQILKKKEALSVDDFIEIQKHPELSAKIVQNIESLRGVTPIILQHHERYDGQGYPNGISGEDIVIEARILSITDAYDAMTTPREHREPMPKDEALYELRLNKGKQFDPDITEKFCELINREGGSR